jgi:DNA end-binding protein Ku
MSLPKDMLHLAEHILLTKTANFDPAFLEDRYRSVLVSMLREKQAEMPVTAAAAAAPSQQNVVSLMEALKRSIAAEQGSGRASASKQGRTRSAAVTPKRSGSRR